MHNIRQSDNIKYPSKTFQMCRKFSKVTFSQAVVILFGSGGGGGGSWLPSMHHRSHDQRGSASCGGLHPGDLPTGGGGDTWNTTGYGQQADGTHPTGMLSGFFYLPHFISSISLKILFFSSNSYF